MKYKIAILFILFFLQCSLAQAFQDDVDFESYNTNNHDIELKLPKGTKVIEESYASDELLFHTHFSNETYGLRGNIQIWQIKESLEDFLNNSLNNSIFYFINHSKESIKVNGYSGYKLNWIAITQTEKTIFAQEFFLILPNTNKFLRISFYNKDPFGKTNEKYIGLIINSVKGNNQVEKLKY